MFPIITKPSQDVKSIQKILYILFSIGITLAILKIGVSILMGMNDLLVTFMFLCGICCANYCMIVVYIVMMLMSMINYFMLFGRIIQLHIHNGETPVGKDFCFTVLFVLAIVSVIYYIVATIFCFEAYKAFKYQINIIGKDIEKGSVHPTSYLHY